MVELKQCNTCRRVKVVTEFYCDKKNKDGLCGSCKECKTAYQRTHYVDHRENITIQMKVYREAHRKERAVYNRVYRVKHREELAAKDRAYRQANREERNARRRHYHAEHRERENARSRVWKKRNIEKVNANNRRRRALKRGATIGPIDHEAIKVRDRMRCCVCGLKVAEKDLSYDHTIPLSLGGPHTQSNLRVCHRRCNSRRGVGRLLVQMVLV